MATPIYPNIPEPSYDPGDLLKTVNALKTIVETFLGQRGTNGWTNQTFYQREEPEAARKGDLWVRYALLAGEVDGGSVWS